MVAEKDITDICDTIDVRHHSHLSIRWLMLRGIRRNQTLVNRKYRDKISDLAFEAIGINPSLTVYGIEKSNDSILSILEERKYLKSVSAGIEVWSAADNCS
jgi:hypothetical protein